MTRFLSLETSRVRVKCARGHSRRMASSWKRPTRRRAGQDRVWRLWSDAARHRQRGFAGLDSPVRPEIVCIILTDHAAVDRAVKAIQQGAYDFLVQPFTAEQVWQAVSRGLERRRLSLQVKRLQAVEAEARSLAKDKARLEEIDKAKMAFIRLVTHELQAPIAAIQNYMQLILDGYVPPEKQRATIERCMARADEQMALIADLLELGKLQRWERRARRRSCRWIKCCARRLSRSNFKRSTSVSGWRWTLPAMC